MVFDGPRAKLPTAMLRPSRPSTIRSRSKSEQARQVRRGAIARDLDLWLSLRWEWVRPRMVPLLAAFIGLLLTLGAVKYTSRLSYDHDFALRLRTLHSHARVSGGTCPRRIARPSLVPVAPMSPMIPIDATIPAAPR